MSIVLFPFRLLIWIWNSSVVRFILFALVILLLAASYYDIEVMNIASADPRVIGPISAWFSSLVTLIAITIAAESLRTTRLKNEQEKLDADTNKLDAERERLEADKRAHLDAISGVYCWLSAKLDTITKEPLTYLVELQNNTNLPIYEWTARIASGEVIADNLRHGPIPPGSSAKELGLPAAFKGIEAPKMPAIEIEFQTPSGEKLARGLDGKIRHLEQ